MMMMQLMGFLLGCVDWVNGEKICHIICKCTELVWSGDSLLPVSDKHPYHSTEIAAQARRECVHMIDPSA